MADRDTYSTAVHEAAHVVVALARGLGIAEASVEPRGGDPGRGGIVRYVLKRPIRSHADQARFLKALALSTLAGPLAERRVRGTPNVLGFGIDNGRVALGSDAYHLLEYVKTFPPGLQDLVASNLKEGAESLLDEHWPAVVRLAAALVEHRTLDGESAATIIGATP